MIQNFVLIIGAMKAGTTSLFQYLAQHPAVAPSREKEPNFFADDANWARGRDWYEALWDWDAGVHQIALEASTHYTKVPGFPSAAERIAQYPARFRFIYLMRHPVDRFESHYSHKSVRGQPQRELRSGFDPQLLAVSEYARQLDEYARRFDRRDILLLNLSELSSSPLEVLRRVSRFLEIDPYFAFTATHRRHNAFRAPPSPRVEALKTLPFVRPVLPLIPPGAKRLARRVLGGPRQGRMRLTPADREAVLRELLPDLRRLRDEYGFDPICWGISV
jgi:hypothetical protein